MNKAMMDALQADQAKLEAMTGQKQPLHFIHEPPWDCLGCGGGDKWPASEAVWVCPTCGTEYRENSE